ncbi:patatin-like phospholipase family protein [Streptomyces mirabilis]|uniref:patatin-like phospholipase family protein n=1 Tax=Streptomyces mirabilis TaxID=68239 RepID=UPI003680E8F8
MTSVSDRLHDTDAPPWNPDHPVLELLRARRAAQSLPGRRTDGKRLGLAVEGGGMRGIISAAMLSALEDMDLLPAFDAVYGCSSGAINAAYFLVGRTWYPLSIYYDDLTTPEFLDFRRALRFQDVLNPHYAIDKVVGKRKPLDYERVLASEIPLHVMITDVDGLKTRDIMNFQDPADLTEALRSTIWLPLAVSGTWPYRGRRTVDGGVLTAHPLFLAREQCTHVLSLSTRPMARPRNKLTALNRVVEHHLERLHPGLGRGYVRAVTEYRAARLVLHDERHSSSQEPHVLDLAPVPGTPELKRHEMDVGKLLAGARSGYEVLHWAVEKNYRRAIPRMTVSHAW